MQSIKLLEKACIAIFYFTKTNIQVLLVRGSVLGGSACLVSSQILPSSMGSHFPM